jgi:hypothetical protein
MANSIPFNITWKQARPPSEVAAVNTALMHPGVVETTLARLHRVTVGLPDVEGLHVRYLATGGAKRVYLIQVTLRGDVAYCFVAKYFLSVQLAHLPPGTTVGGASHDAEDLEARLLAHVVWAAQRVDDLAPGLCPRFGGFWEWVDARGGSVRIMTEAYVRGDSLERWKGVLEDRFTQGVLDFSQYTARRLSMERQAIATYIRLWDVLGRCTFTSDPSPWNVLFTPIPGGYRPTLIDLHSIHDGGTPLYVFQTLEELFGNRDEIRLQALCPGILDALGVTDGVQMLKTVRGELKAQAEARELTGLSPFTASIGAISNFLA